MNRSLFQRPVGVTSSLQIISWWEYRRIPFNIIVGVTGILTCVFLTIEEIFFEDKLGGSIIGTGGSPLIIGFGIMGIIAAYGIVANICYTCGWMSELLARYLWREEAEHFGKITFVFGLLFSVFLTLSPIVISAVLILVNVLIP